jgi:hypothetical protein
LDFWWFFLQCQVPRTTPCLLSHLSHPISKHLLYAHEFIFLSKKNFCFWKFGVDQFLASQTGISAPMGRISGGGGRIIRANFGKRKSVQLTSPSHFRSYSSPLFMMLESLGTFIIDPRWTFQL